MRWLKALFSFGNPGEKPAPIITDYHERGTNREFRRPDDPEHVIRINQDQPKGCPRKIENYVAVAGVSRPEYRTALIGLIQGHDRQVLLERDPGNAYDPNAIKVIGRWIDKNGTESISQIGWVPKEIAASVLEQVPDRPIGATIEAMFRPSREKAAGMRIAIWGPRRKSKELSNE